MRNKTAVPSRKRRKKQRKAAKGFYGHRKNYRQSKSALMKAAAYSTRDRKRRKRDFRSLWILRISAAVRAAFGLPYNKFIHGLRLANVVINRKMLAWLVLNDQPAFESIVNKAKEAISNKKAA